MLLGPRRRVRGVHVGSEYVVFQDIDDGLEVFDTVLSLPETLRHV